MIKATLLHWPFTCLRLLPTIVQPARAVSAITWCLSHGSCASSLQLLLRRTAALPQHNVHHQAAALPSAQAHPSALTPPAGQLPASCGRGLALAAAATINDSTPNVLHLLESTASAPDHAAAVAASQAGTATGTPNPADLCQVLLQLLQRHKLQQDPTSQLPQEQQLASTIHRLSSHPAPTLPAQQLIALLEAALQQQQQQQGAQGRLLSVLESCTAHSLQSLTPHQLAAVLAALKRLQDGMPPQDSTTITSASSSSHRSAQGLVRPTPMQPPQASQQQLLSKAVLVYLQQHQQQLDAPAIAAIAAALAPYPRARACFTVLSMLALEQLQAMTPQQLTQLMASFAQAQHYNQAVCDAAAELAVTLIKQQGFKLAPPPQPADPAAQQTHTSTAAQSVARPKHAADAFQAPPSPHKAAAKQQVCFTAAQLVSLQASLAALRHHAPTLLEAACTLLLRDHQRSLSDLISLAHSCALLNHYHIPLFDAAVSAAQLAMQQQRQQGASPCDMPQQHHHQQQHQQHQQQQQSLPVLMARLCWSCGVMGHWQPDFLQDLFTWSSTLQPSSCSNEELLQWYQVQSHMTDAMLLQPHSSPHGLSSSLMVAAQGVWAARQQGQRLVAFQREVVEALQQAGVRVKPNVVLDGAVVVDVALRLRQVGARYKLALQLHPAEDFAANPPHGALGPTAARWRALQARGWRVVALQQSQWRKLTRQQQVEYAWQLAQGVEVNAPGTSHVVDQVVVDKPPGRKPSLQQTLLRILVEGK